MTHDVVTETVAARPIAAVRRRVRGGEIATSWRPALDLVWAFLRRHEGLRTDGHNIFVYHHPGRPGEPIAAEFGVEVSGPFDGEGEVVFSHTPAGEVASTVHIGTYGALADAHEAIAGWCAEHGRTFAGASWEIYGDPSADPSQNEVRVSYLLA